MLSSKASWVWYMNIARSCFYFHISLLYTYFTLRLTIYQEHRFLFQSICTEHSDRNIIRLYFLIHHFIYKHYNLISHGVVNVSLLSLIILRYTWRMHRRVFFMNTIEFTIDCIFRGLAWKFENQIESFRCFCFCYYFWKKIKILVLMN